VLQVVRDRFEPLGREGDGAHPGGGLRCRVEESAVLWLGLSAAHGDSQSLQESEVLIRSLSVRFVLLLPDTRPVAGRWRGPQDT
jgi:hypothetical protein